MADDIYTDNNTKKLEASNGKCENCGGDLVFDPKIQKMICHNCDSQFDIAKVPFTQKHNLRGANEDFDEHESWVNEMKMVKCQTCGAEIMLDSHSMTSCCPYCGSNYVVQPQSLKGLKPDDVLPFCFNEDECAERFAKGIKKKFFAPSEFKKKLKADKIYGIYVPSFLFDADTSSHYSGVLEKRKTRKNSKGQTVTYYESFHISGDKDMTHRNYVIESSSKMTGKEMNALLPYYLDKAVNFEPGFIRGFAVEHYDEPLSTCYNNAKSQMEDAIKKSVLSQYTYDRIQSFNLSTKYSAEKYAYTLLPVYCLDFLWKEKKYMVFVNGETGKIGTGYPKSKLKMALVYGGIAFLVIAFIVAIFILAYYDSLN